MLLEKENSCLLLIDVQEKLAPLVTESDAMIARCGWLLRLAKELQVPGLASEQYPQGLGSTVKTLRELITSDTCVNKVHFSCCREPNYQACWEQLGKKQAVLAGIETHVCVLQTAMDMMTAGVEVFVVVDAVSSRHEIDHRFGLERLKMNGANLVTAEMVFFEWLKQAGTLEFKKLSQAFLR